MNSKLQKALVLGFFSLQVLSLSSCSTFDRYAEKAKAISIDAGQSLGLLAETKLEVPDYYSKEYLPKGYRPGETLELQQLQCANHVGCNK